MAVSWLGRLAARAPVPVYPLLGIGGERALYPLALAGRVTRVDSPRHASVLLVAGHVPVHHHEALKRVHDQLPRPFATLWFRSQPLPGLENARRVDDPATLTDELVALHRELQTGQRGSSPRLLPDEPPNPWEGLGDDGHGGEGMMGGTPYGRPMAMNMQDDIRDGLTLDSLTFRLGPFYPLLPPGLAAEITLQGDVIQSWTNQSPAYPRALDAVFQTARERPVAIAELELARARHHLRHLYRALRLAGLEGLGLKALRLARELTPASHLDGLRRQLTRAGFFRLAALDGGALDAETARRLGGPAARAAGIDTDRRSDDAHYRRLGFRPALGRGGDTRARWHQKLAEIEQSLALAGRAVDEGDLTTVGPGGLETPCGPWRERPAQDAGGCLEALLPGMEWDSALATIASLDLAEGSASPPPGEAHAEEPQ
ncbi:NADH-quinone oxidoreductase subunit D-related protein [Modicisalibacter radicis]|uniref:NADH-quinone oxidoreductase subunit D-related protein n=1 Tax=Halomonas sp. EAR18 TaxID=2518972 RepID=UPI00109D5155|nr:hypothetical protein [Halomonas sp. EAR18]